jgi:hypothetical protein
VRSLCFKHIAHSSVRDQSYMCSYIYVVLHFAVMAIVECDRGLSVSFLATQCARNACCMTFAGICVHSHLLPLAVYNFQLATESLFREKKMFQLFVSVKPFSSYPVC